MQFEDNKRKAYNHPTHGIIRTGDYVLTERGWELVKSISGGKGCDLYTGPFWLFDHEVLDVQPMGPVNQ